MKGRVDLTRWSRGALADVYYSDERRATPLARVRIMDTPRHWQAVVIGTGEVIGEAVGEDARWKLMLVIEQHFHDVETGAAA